MKKIALFALAGSAALALSACGSSNDASEEAMADTVEIPAEEAMEEAPMPAEDVDVVEDAATDAAGEVEEATEEVEQTAAQAAEDAQAAADDVEAAIQAAEAATE